MFAGLYLVFFFLLLGIFNSEPGVYRKQPLCFCEAVARSAYTLPPQTPLVGFHWVEMIIKGLFRRYERWNPVHPTYGAFWGMGIGVGCGVGWGPGFGPEAIGYVGAGCGVGFSVGFSLLGIGIGLPANYIFTVPYNAFSAIRSGAIEMSRSTDIQNMRNIVEDSRCCLDSNISGLQEKMIQTFSSFRVKESVGKVIDSSETPTKMSFPNQCMDRLKQGINGLLHPCKGSKD